ncbi:TfuA-like protein [Streptomyces sp. NPDC050315]|uniref:TfuA-like protein n=1 Tax=Streptomyces sp. NPDC050315 TaxID=3155039 RepID=UPI0034160AC0
MRTVVFVGPSLPHEEASAHLPDAEFLPPIERGGIGALMAQKQPPQQIGIIDGKFLQSFSISPKEILRAMDRGVRVYGSSSMGALRAAELDVYGMTGVGTVYAMYASGTLEDDDEVAITFDSESLRPVCEPMVNIRVATEAALRREVVSEENAELFLKAAKSLYFPQRTSTAALRHLKGVMPEPDRQRLADYLRSSEAPDAKREDAIALLARMRQDATTYETLAASKVAA